MRRFFKWLGIVLGALAGLALAAALFVYVVSQREISRKYDAPLTAFNAPSDRDTIRRGERLAAIYGCSSCHGADLTGTDAFNFPGIVHITAPNLTQVVKEYTDQELERVVRRGVKRDGTSTWIMPSAMFNRLTDEDLAAIVAYVRSFPERPGIDRLTNVGPLGRIGIIQGKFTSQAAQASTLPALPQPSSADPLAHGRYLVMTSCTECHGHSLQGSDFVGAPNLTVIAAYSDADFSRLMHEGVGAGARDLGLMSEVARDRFSLFSEGDIQDIRQYLLAFSRTSGTRLP